MNFCFASKKFLHLFLALNKAKRVAEKIGDSSKPFSTLLFVTFDGATLEPKAHSSQRFCYYWKLFKSIKGYTTEADFFLPSETKTVKDF